MRILIIITWLVGLVSLFLDYKEFNSFIFTCLASFLVGEKAMELLIEFLEKK